MQRKKVENHLKEKVKIKLFDGDTIEGVLRKTGDDDFKNNPNLYIPRNYYFLVDSNLNCISCIFKLTHIVSIKPTI